MSKTLKLPKGADTISFNQSIKTLKTAADLRKQLEKVCNDSALSKADKDVMKAMVGYHAGDLLLNCPASKGEAQALKILVTETLQTKPVIAKAQVDTSKTFEDFSFHASGLGTFESRKAEAMLVGAVGYNSG